MIRSTLLTMSEGVSIDQLTGGLVSIYNIMEQINVVELPTLVPRIFVVAFFERGLGDDEQFELEYKLFSGDEEIESKKIGLDFKGNTKHKRIHSFNSIELKKEGQLRLSLYIDGKEINRSYINVMMVHNNQHSNDEKNSKKPSLGKKS